MNLASDKNEKGKGLYSKSVYNETLQGLGDFGRSKMRKASEFFLTLETSACHNAKHLFGRVQENLQGQVLVTYKCSDGFTDHSLVHLYYKNEDFKFSPNVFLSIIEDISSMKCLEIKKIIYKRALLKSMTPWGCLLGEVYTSKIPNTFLGGGGIQKPKMTERPIQTKNLIGKPKPNIIIVEGRRIHKMNVTASTRQINNLKGQPSGQQPVPREMQTLQAEAEANNPITEFLATKQAEVRLLKKSLERAQAEYRNTENLWHQWNNEYVKKQMNLHSSN